ncbi:hypothetical protein B0I35DRAFT_438461 [Stachybotrys elegans]|uniref:Tat pathway signal sequence protein n=1 Tax=Stachybotrys elegans TaxID=80388 RepID=A0A8K0WNP5_9HYPO|nr:hypothetical protein B0I35DRAFT_438461 [Stachybotrys elegans]
MASLSIPETKHFLGTDECGSPVNCDCSGEEHRPATRSFRNFYAPYLFHSVFVCLNLVLFLWNITSSNPVETVCPGDEVNEAAFSPARTALRYVVQDFETGPSPFVGEPSKELDQAWSDLLRSSNIKISNDEMNRMNKSSIEIRDGSGYIGYLESIHMLHCVKRIYQSQYQEYYAKPQDMDAFSPGHWNHCLEVLRQGIMCNADVTVNTYFWKSPDEIKGNRHGHRRCTDWSLVQQWLDDRSLDFENKEIFLSSLVYQEDSSVTV